MVTFDACLNPQYNLIMHTWNLAWNDPLYPLLSADVRLGAVDFCDDQVWQLHLGAGDPPALALSTTYGLRARGMRLFPVFTEAGRAVSDPADFAGEVRFLQLHPNYLRCSFAPLDGIDVILEAWVPDSHTLSGRLRVRNNGPTPRQVRMEWVAQLSPVDGEQMHPASLSGVQVLCGATGNLKPLVFFTGGIPTVASPLPAFVCDFDLLPGTERTLRWAHVGLSDLEAGLDHARRTVAHPWDAAIARIALVNAAQVRIRTGDPALDATLHMAQNAALSLIHHHPEGDLPHPFFVTRRDPDLGYSLAGDGSDYPPAWRGGTPLTAWHLAQTLLLIAPEIVAGWVENFLQHTSPDGAVDMQPGPARQQSNVLAPPILISLAGEVFRRTRDRAWLERVFPKLIAFFHHWFHEHHDADGDGFPEWEHPLQLETEEHPAFTPWETWTQGLDVHTVEDPALGAMLIHAAHTLIDFAHTLQASAPLAALQALSENLHNALQLAWHPERGFLAWDRDTHRSPTGEQLGTFHAQADVEIRRRWETPQRLVLHLLNPDTTPHTVEVFIQGLAPGEKRRVERLSLSPAQWLGGQATLTSQETYIAVEHITLQDFSPKGTLLVSTADLAFDCLTHFLPLWAGVADEAQAEQMHALLTDPDGYDQPFGLPFCPTPPDEAAADTCLRVLWPWAGLVLDGLLRYGYRATAADFYLRTLNGTARILQQEHTFRRAVHAGDGRGLGERGSAFGLPPVGLFLRIAGIELISPWEVHVLDHNPFPWPLEVTWRGLHIRHTDTDTTITFPNGKQIHTLEIEVRVVGRPVAEKV